MTGANNDRRVNLMPTVPNEERLEYLRALVPEAFSDGAIDFEQLREALGLSSETIHERFVFSWMGKQDSLKLIQMPSRASLNPDPEESVEFDSAENLLIEGDNLEVLKLLYKAYFSRIKMIYIDPPYNTGKDFVYPDGFGDPLGRYLTLTGQKDSEGNLLTSNPETSGRYHSAWLTMMYPRLFLARQLLRDDGIIFVSIDDHEVHNLRQVMNQIFGEENSLTWPAGTTLIWNKQHSQQQGVFKRYHEYVLVYAKNAKAIDNIQGGEGTIEAGALKKISRANPSSTFTFPAGVRFDAPDGTVLTGTFGDSEKVTVVSGRLIAEGGKTQEEVTLSAGWTQKAQMQSWFKGEETIDTKGQTVTEFYFNSRGKLKVLKDRSSLTPSTILPPYGMVSESTAALAQLMGESVFDNPKPVEMIQDFCSWFLGENDIVLDFFAGSGTTADAVMRLNQEDGGNRRYVLVQFPETLDPNKQEQAAAAAYCEALNRPLNLFTLTRERILLAGKKLAEEESELHDELGVLGDKNTYFRVFRLAESSIQSWEDSGDSEPKVYAEQLAFYADPLRPGWNELDLLWEIALKEGFSLTSIVTKIDLKAITVFRLTDDSGGQTIYVSLEDKIDLDSVKLLELDKADRFICRDVALNDSIAANLALQCRLITI